MANLSFTHALLCEEEPNDRSALDIAFSVIETLFCLLAVVCNGAVAMILYQKPKLRNKSNSHLMNLVVADFLYCLTLPLTMSSTLAGGWQLGVVVCQLHGFFTLCVVLAIEFNFPMMAIYRLIVITRSQHRLADFYKLHTHGLLATTWISAALCAFPPLVGWGRFGYCNGIPDCFLTIWHSKTYVTFLLITTTVIPCVIMAFCYIKVIITVRQSSKRVRSAAQNAISGSSASLAVCDDRRIRASSPSPSVLYSDRDFLPIPQNQPSNKAVAANQRRPSAVSVVGRNRESMRRGSLASIASSTISNVRPSELRLGKSLALVTMSYVCTWLPVVACVVRAVISTDVSKELEVHLIQLFLFVHVAVNPLVYGLLNDPFKSVLAKLLCWKRPESSQETERWVPPSVASTVPHVKMTDRATRQENHTAEVDEKRTRSSLTPQSDSKQDKDMRTRQQEAPISDLPTSQQSAIAGSSGKR